MISGPEPPRLKRLPARRMFLRRLARGIGIFFAPAFHRFLHTFHLELVEQ